MLRVRQLRRHRVRLTAEVGAIGVVSHVPMAAVALASAEWGKLHASVMRRRVAVVHTDVS